MYLMDLYMLWLTRIGHRSSMNFKQVITSYCIYIERKLMHTSIRTSSSFWFMLITKKYLKNRSQFFYFLSFTEKHSNISSNIIKTVLSDAFFNNIVSFKWRLLQFLIRSILNFSQNLLTIIISCISESTYNI